MGDASPTMSLFVGRVAKRTRVRLGYRTTSEKNSQFSLDPGCEKEYCFFLRMGL